MRLFILLAALSPLLDATLTRMINSAQNKSVDVAHYQLPNGLYNGDIISFVFQHVGNDSKPESVNINFYDLPYVDTDGLYSIDAHFRFDRHLRYPVTTNAYVSDHYIFDASNFQRRQPGGTWLTPTVIGQHLDQLPPSNGWWRVDLIKHDKYRMGVFFQGYWSGIRTFNMSHDSTQSIYVMSDFVDQHTVEMSINTPREVAPLSAAQFRSYINNEAMPDKNFASYFEFPQGSHIEMTAVLRASGSAKHREPAIIIASQNDSASFIKIFQRWEGETAELYLTTSHQLHNETLCTNQTRHGDLQELYLERYGPDLLLRVFYKRPAGLSVSEYMVGVTCEQRLPAEIASMLEEPIHIIGRDGAMILRMRDSFPRRVMVKDHDDEPTESRDL